MRVNVQVNTFRSGVPYKYHTWSVQTFLHCRCVARRVDSSLQFEVSCTHVQRPGRSKFQAGFHPRLRGHDEAALIVGAYF